MSRLVIDASAYFPMAVLGTVPEQLAAFELVGPALLWSETLSALREAVWRGALAEPDANAAVARLDTLGVARVSEPRLGAIAYELAGDLGWAKTYDAEYVALAKLLDAKLLTRDARLRRGAHRVVEFYEPG